MLSANVCRPTASCEREKIGLSTHVGSAAALVVFIVKNSITNVKISCQERLPRLRQVVVRCSSKRSKFKKQPRLDASYREARKIFEMSINSRMQWSMAVLKGSEEENFSAIANRVENQQMYTT